MSSPEGKPMLAEAFFWERECALRSLPYNTGNEGWCYNDAVNSPRMREWLKKSSNPAEREDLQRHDKWLCMMWPRLQLIKELLADEGAFSSPLTTTKFTGCER